MKSKHDWTWRHAAVFEVRETGSTMVQGTKRLLRWVPLLGWAAACNTGCVFPSRHANGVELSWLFVEGNRSDDDNDSSLPVRTCEGFGVDHLEVLVEDENDADRSERFSFSCTEGYQTPLEFQLEASDVFLELRAGEYRFETEVFGSSPTPIAADERIISVGTRSVTSQGWDFVPALVTWHVALANLQACSTIEMRLLYADPAEHLAPLDENPKDEEPADDHEEVLYRHQLTSDAGLSLGGDTVACPALAPFHHFHGMDRGSYVLEITVDERRHTLPVAIELGGEPLRVDLADLSSAG